MNTKKFIAPGGWFEMQYPLSLTEFEDEEGSFLFYNPDSWNGNFRISAYRGDSADFARQCLQEDLSTQKGARKVRVGDYECSYSQEAYIEQEVRYKDHYWVFGSSDMAFYASLAGEEDFSTELAEQIIASVKARDLEAKYPAETIQIRVKEIQEIDEAYDMIQRLVKEKFTVDFRGEPQDIRLMQRLLKDGGLNPKKREVWIALGITLLAILTNQYEGFEWKTLIDGDREAPVLMRLANGEIIDPLHLVWSKVKRDQQVDLEEVFDKLLSAES